MQQSFWNKRIPNLFAVIALIFSLGALYWLQSNQIIFRGRAQLSNTPENIRVTDISDTMFTVSYKTKDAVFGSLSYGEDATLGSVGLDDRDQLSGEPQPYTVHRITVKNLSPQTKYFFSIQSGDTTFVNNNAPFEITTALEISATPPSQPPVSGKIISSGEQTVPSLVLITPDNAQTLSVLTKTDGIFSLPLNGLLSRDLSGFADLTEDNKVTVLVSDGRNQSQVIAFVKQANPLPLITLGNNYDFTVSTEALMTVDATPSAESIGFPSFNAFQAQSDEPIIITPKKDQEFSDQQPSFEGVTAPGKTVEIVINSETITASVKADSKGNWKYRPSQKLEPGEHAITITTRDRFNIIKTITQSFTVHAQGSQFTEPSVSQNPSPTPVSTATPTQTVRSSPTPTVRPTATPMPTATIAPTQIPVTQDVTQPPPVTDINSGNSPILLLSFAAIGSIGLGLLLFFLSRKSFPL